MSVWIRCLPVNMDALHSMLVAIFLFFPFVKSKNIVVLRKVYPKFSLFFCFSIWCFASYALDWDSFCCSCLFVCVSSFVDFVDLLLWTSITITIFPMLHQWSVMRLVLGVGSAHKWAQILIYLQFPLNLFISLSPFLSLTLYFFFS